MMKAAAVVLIMLITAYIFPAAASGDELCGSIPGYESSRALAAGADTKRIESKMAEALSDLVSQRQAAIDRKISETASGSSSVNSSVTNQSATNSSAMNSSTIDSSILNSNIEGTLAQNGSASPQGIESSSKTSFKGYYGITASQHQMGKNDINSRTFLSGTFSMDKSVKFQDRGIQ
jgi:hypothetical protein